MESQHKKDVMDSLSIANKVTQSEQLEEDLKAMEAMTCMCLKRLVWSQSGRRNESNLPQEGPKGENMTKESCECVGRASNGNFEFRGFVAETHREISASG